MTGKKLKAPAGFPPVWVKWRDVPRHLARRFGIDAGLMGDIRSDLHSALQKHGSQIQHHIPGIRADRALPGVLKEEIWSSTDTRTLVMDWSLVVFDPVKGSITAEDVRTGELIPIPIEVRWPSVEKWFEQIGQRKSQWRIRQTQRLDGSLVSASEPQRAPAGSAADASHETKLAYSEEALVAWFRLRCFGWPAGQRFPSEEKDRGAAEAEFDGMDKVSRERFRQIRTENTPPDWHKPGPRVSKS